MHPAARATPLVSVLVPTYNSCRWLPRTIPAVLAQSLGDFELVVSDDGSSDQTVPMLEELAAADGRIRFLGRRPERLGLRRHCEVLLEEARGVYVKLLMAEDLLMPTALEKLVAGMEADPGVTLATARRVPLDAAGTVQPDGPVTAPVVTTSQVLDGLAFGDRVLEDQINYVGEPSVALFRRADVVPRELFTLAGVTFGTLIGIAAWVRLLARGACFYEADILSGFTQHDGQLGRATENQVLECVEWAAVLRHAPALGFLADPDRRARALGVFVKRWAGWPLERANLGLAAVARELAWATGELAALHAALGAEGVRIYDAHRRLAGGPADGGAVAAISA